MAEVRGNVADARGVIVLMPTTAFTTAATVTGKTFNIGTDVTSISIQWIFVRGGGGTTLDAYLQTSLDGGTTWTDIYNCKKTTTSENTISVNIVAAVVDKDNTDATLADNTAENGIIGSLIRIKFVTTGTYTGTSTIKASAVIR